MAAILALLAVASAASTACAQPAATPWRLQDALDPPSSVRLSGSVRGRYETLDGQFRAGKSGGDQQILLRTTVLAEWRRPGVRGVAEVVDARAYLADAGGAVTTGDVNALEPVQAHVAIDLSPAMSGFRSAELLAGRFTQDLGSRRLVGIGETNNAPNAFTGVKLTLAGRDRSMLSAFYTLPLVRRPEDVDSLLDNDVQLDRESGDLRFWGLFYARPGMPFGSAAELFVFGLKEGDASDRPTRDRDLLTPGARVYRDPKAGAWDFEVEGGVQRGTVRASTAPAAPELDVDAAYLHVEVGRRFDAPWTPRVALEYALATGDEDPDDSRSNRFDSLFGPRRADFGPTGAYGPLQRANLRSPGLRVEATPGRRWDAMAFYRLLYLDEPRDAFAGTGVRDVSGRSGETAGRQFEARARYWVVPDSLRLEVGGAWLDEGPFLERAPNRTADGDTLYGYTDLTFSF